MIGFQFYSKEGPLPFQGEIIMKKAKIQNLKIVFSRTTCPISIKLYTKQPWMKGIQVCSNEGPRAFTMGDNSEIAKLHWQNFKKLFFLRTSWPISTNLAQSILGCWEFKFVQKKGHMLLQGEIIMNSINTITEVKNHLLLANFNHT